MKNEKLILQVLQVLLAVAAGEHSDSSEIQKAFVIYIPELKKAITRIEKEERNCVVDGCGRKKAANEVMCGDHVIDAIMGG